MIAARLAARAVIPSWVIKLGWVELGRRHVPLFGHAEANIRRMSALCDVAEVAPRLPFHEAVFRSR